MSYSSDSTLRQIPPAARKVFDAGRGECPTFGVSGVASSSLPCPAPSPACGRVWWGCAPAELLPGEPGVPFLMGIQLCSHPAPPHVVQPISCTKALQGTFVFPCVLCELCFWPLLQEFSSWPCFSAHEKSQILLSTAQFGYKYLSVDDRRLRNHSINVAALGVEKVLKICDSETGSMTPLSQLSCSLPQHSSLHQNYCCWEFCVVFSSPLALLLICRVYKAFFPVTLILISVEKKKLILIYWGRKQKK